MRPATSWSLAAASKPALVLSVLSALGVLLARPARAEEVLVTPPPASPTGGPQAPGAAASGGAVAPAPPLPPAEPPPAAESPPPHADTPPPPPPEEKKPPAGWIPGSGFIIQSDDAAYRLRIGLQAGYKFEPVYQNGDWQGRNAFFVLRPFIGGNFFREWIHFWTSLETAANPPYVLDSFVEAMPYKEFGIRVGQMWTPYDRHEYFGPQEILFPEWAPVSEYFWPGRDKGATILGTLAGTIDYYLGIFSGTPLRQYTSLPGNYDLQARVTVNPMGPTGTTEFPYIISDGPAPFRISATLQGYYGKVQLAQQNFNPSTFNFETMATGDTRKQAAGGADFWIQGRWFMAYVDGTVRRTEPPMGAPSYTSVGVWGQVGVLVIEKTMDAAVRVNWLNPSTSLSDDTFYSVEGQLAWYVSHTQNLVIKLRYGIGHQDSPGTYALGAVPLVLSEPGRAQIFTLQLNLAF